MIDIKQMTVLIADDVESMFTSIRSIMKLLGFGKKFLYAANGVDALQILRQGSVDLALLDNNMPVMSGLELLEEIRQDDILADMPVIMITAHAEKEFITNAAESEIDAYILKPVTVKLLDEKIPPVIERANNPSPMFFYLKEAKRFRDDGDLDSAIEQARLAMAANPKSSRPLREAGFYYMQKGDHAAAEETLLRAVEMNPIDVVAFNHLGELYLGYGNIDKALTYFSRAVDISPRHYERSLNLGRLLIRKQMEEKAMPVFSKVFELSKEPLDLKEQIAYFCLEHGARTYALRLLMDVAGQDRKREKVMLTIGVELEAQGKKEEALSYLLEADALNAAGIETKLRIAALYLSLGRVIRAEKHLKEILSADPDNARAAELLRQCV